MQEYVYIIILVHIDENWMEYAIKKNFQVVAAWSSIWLNHFGNSSYPCNYPPNLCTDSLWRSMVTGPKHDSNSESTFQIPHSEITLVMWLSSWENHSAVSPLKTVYPVNLWGSRGSRHHGVKVGNGLSSPILGSNLSSVLSL